MHETTLSPPATAEAPPATAEAPPAKAEALMLVYKRGQWAVSYTFPMVSSRCVLRAATRVNSALRASTDFW